MSARKKGRPWITCALTRDEISLSAHLFSQSEGDSLRHVAVRFSVPHLLNGRGGVRCESQRLDYTRLVTCVRFEVRNDHREEVSGS